MSNEIPKVNIGTVQRTMLDEILRPGAQPGIYDPKPGAARRTIPVGSPDYEGVDKEESYD